MLYKIYAGMGGGFGGAEYIKTEDYPSSLDASRDAYDIAVDFYHSYEGYNGILSYKDCYDDLLDSWDEEPDDEAIENYYRQKIESWIDYYVEPA